MSKKYTHRLTIVGRDGNSLHDQGVTLLLEKDRPILKDEKIEIGYEIKRKDGSKSYSWVTLLVVRSATNHSLPILESSNDIFLTCTPTAKNGGLASVKRLIEYKNKKKQ